MAGWNSNQYLKFKNQRSQPAIDLAMRIKNCNPKTVVDIGCGPGNSTAILNDTFPDADIMGIDNSPNMIEKAQAEHPDIAFRLCSALALRGKYDLLFSNACLQWIPEHELLIPALMDKLHQGGTLAVQVPMNEEEPLFQIIDEVAAESCWRLAAAPLPTNKTLSPQQYFEILTACASTFEIWETKYYHILDDHNALIEWVKGSRLRPYLDFLGEPAGKEFEQEIEARAKKFYPIQKGGGVILGFRRFFFTAVK